MAIDETPVTVVNTTEPSPDPMARSLFAVTFLVLAALAAGEIYAIHRTDQMRSEVTAQQAQLRDDFNGQLRDQVSNRLAAMEQQNEQDLNAVKTELDDAAKRVGAQGGELRHARKMVAQLQDQERTQTDQLKQAIDQKADEQQVGALSQDVSTTKSDLDTTKTNVSTLASDLGMARSDMGNLIARNHDDIEYLRKLGERDYFEFTLTRNQPSKVAGVQLTLKKTNPKHYQYNLATLVDDMNVERKDCSANSPVYFYVNGSKKPFELVVNSVASNQVKGYVSAPKGSTEMAATSGAAH